ncbi:MAG: ATP-binding protein, partial [Rhodothermales bacterium]|nr:ATP-binding protein [Rhodothermales bacterium]
ALLLLAAAAAGSAYAVAHRLLAGRLALARTTLRQIRKRRFENLEAVRPAHGDELNDLIWQVYRTGQAHEKEIRELKRLENYRREFLGNVSHELKTPIFAIRGFAETLLGGALDDEQVNRAFVEKIVRNADRLGNLTRDLAEVSRIEMGELEMARAPFALAPLVREVAESLEPLATAKQIALGVQVPPDLPAVFGDRERIRQVLINLIDNAVKYNSAGGHVEVVARHAAEGLVKVSVVDDGIGIAPEHLPRLTERFFRVDTSRSRSQGGTGLGLAIVKHLLSAHGSRLVVESLPGKGSTFGFALPVAGG